MSKKQLFEIIKIICTAVVAIAATFLVQSCTISLSVSKNNTNSSQTTEQTSTADSLTINNSKQ